MSADKDQLRRAKEAQKESEKQVLELRRELEASRQNPDNKFQHENFTQSAIRRIGLINNFAKAKTIFFNISNDIKPLIPIQALQCIDNIKLSRWPNQLQYVCIDFKTDQCDSRFCHMDKEDKRKNRLHVCALCIYTFQAGFHHSARSCPSLSIADSNAVAAGPAAGFQG